jgi:hypothetical protein
MGESIHVRGEGGVVWEMDLPLPDGVAQRLENGDLTHVNEDGSPSRESEDPDGSDPDPYAVARPANSASKADWVVYAVSKGSAVNDADGMTKAELVEKYG